MSQRILVVDDDRSIVKVLCSYLEQSGYQTLSAYDGEMALHQLRRERPDLVILDLMMPKRDGWEVTQMVRGDKTLASTPIIMLTARVEDTDKIVGLELGADDYITKPFDHRELLARISAIFNRYHKGQEDMRRKMDDQISQFQKEISHNVSHELRTPLAQILLALDMVLRDKYDSPEDLRQFMEIALSQSRKLNGIIDDLIFISNYDRGEVSTLRQKINIELDFSEVIQTVRLQYADKNLKTKVNIAPDVIIHAPRREFRQAVYHLVDNAAKFSLPLTNILIDLNCNGAGGFILTITDYGIGIPPEFTEEVFKRYFQISQGDRRAYSGLGVGLTISRIFSQSLGGDTMLLPSTHGCRIRMIVPPCKLDLP